MSSRHILSTLVLSLVALTTSCGPAEPLGVCQPGAEEACYSGPAGTADTGSCQGGTRTCLADGTGFSACEGEVLPAAESCGNLVDEDCDGQLNEAGEGCACVPGDVESCYSGQAATRGIGACADGTQTCNPEGTGFGACEGEVLPQPETCQTAADDNCDGSTSVNESGAACVCAPGSSQACYSGLEGTRGVGACTDGSQTCSAEGTGYGPCQGEVHPEPETCLTSADDDCDGSINEDGEGCTCVPGATAPCYSGLAGTLNVGDCRAGTQTCNAGGDGYGPCQDEVVPGAEVCGNANDEDCNGVTEVCPTTYEADVKPIFGALCGPCHTGGGSGGHNMGTSYQDTQLSSYLCAGLTKGACSIVQIQNGYMPFNKGCTGDPAQDASKPECLTAAQQATIQRWIDEGQLP